MISGLSPWRRATVLHPEPASRRRRSSTARSLAPTFFCCGSLRPTNEIQARTGVKPFLISDDASIQSGTPVRSPSSLFQDDRECVVEETVEKLREHRWMWGPVMRLSSSCDVPHGQSGGPVLRLDSNQLIGVMGTASDDNAAPCELNNPCLVKADGTFSPAIKDQGYAHFVHQLYTCLDDARSVDINTPGCLLPKPKRR